MSSQIAILNRQNTDLEANLAGLKAVPAVVPRPSEPLLMQLEDMRSGHAAERQLHEKEKRKLNAELKSAKRDCEYLKQQLTDLESEYASCLARVREQADELSAAQKEVLQYIS